MDTYWHSEGELLKDLKPEAIFWGNICYHDNGDGSYRIFLTYTTHATGTSGFKVPVGRGEAWLEETFEGGAAVPPREMMVPTIERTKEMVYGGGWRKGQGVLDGV